MTEFEWLPSGRVRFGGQEIDQNEFEDICIRCGACCGVYDGDPCIHLHRDENWQYYCDQYEDRLGMQRTISGREIECISILEMLDDEWIGDHLCGYKKKLKVGSIETAKSPV